MPEDTIINFEDTSKAGTEIIDNYASKGVTFKIGSNFDMGYPIIQRVGQGLANSGDRVLVIRNCSGDFCQSKLIGKFNYTREQVQVFVGELGDSSIHTKATLYAFDAHNNIVAEKSAVVTGGTGIRTQLMIDRREGDIDTFWVIGDGFTSRLAIDDLRFSNSAKTPDPDFGFTRDGPVGDGVRQGFSANATLKLNRINGSVGNILFEATNLPPGVSASFSPNPTYTDDVLLTLSAVVDSPVSMSAVTIRATPQDNSAGRETRYLIFPLTVAANFAIESLTVDVPCAPTSSLLKVYTPNVLGSPEPGIIPTMFTGSVTLSLSPSPTEIDIKFDPPTIKLDRLEEVTTVRITPLPRVIPKSIVINIEGKSPPYPSVSSHLIVRRTGGSPDSFSPTIGETPRLLSPGTDIVLSGEGFCSPSLIPILVQFGNVYAKANVSSISSDGRLAHVAVPRLATNGELTAVSVSGTSATKLSGELTIRSYRNTNGFRFHNFPVTGIDYGDLTEAFGQSQTWVSVEINPCKHASFGLISCELATISLFPNPLGLIILGIVSKSLDHACYGMSVTSARLSKGHLSFGSFVPSGATNVWQLYDAGGPMEPLAHHIRIQCLTQFSSEVFKFWLDQSDIFSLEETSYFSTQAKNIITTDLQTGKCPFIMMSNGSSGHVVVAYDLEDSDDPDIAYYIYVYDPNDEYTKDENVIPDTHLYREQTLGRITVYKNGRFSPPKNLDWDSSYEVHGHLIVVPYDVIPFNPTFPVSPDGVVMLVSGSASIEQVTDAKDHKLFKASGTINTDPETRLISRVAPWAPFNGFNQPEISKSLILEDNGFYRWTLKGMNDGKYSNFVLAEHMGMIVDELPVSPTSLDEIYVNTHEGSFGFHTTEPSKPLSVKLVTRSSDASLRTIALNTTSTNDGHDEISFDESRDTIYYRHEGQMTTFTITLGWAGNSDLPTVFTSEPIPIGPGETAAFRPTDWHLLNQTPVDLLITGPNNPNRQPQKVQSIQDTRLFTIDLLNTLVAGPMQKNLEIHTTFPQLSTNSTVVLIWLVTKANDNRVIGQHVQELSRSQLQTGSRIDSWTFLSQEQGEFNFTACVMLVTGELLPRSQVLNQAVPFTI